MCAGCTFNKPAMGALAGEPEQRPAPLLTRTSEKLTCAPCSIWGCTPLPSRSPSGEACRHHLGWHLASSMATTWGRQEGTELGPPGRSSADRRDGQRGPRVLTAYLLPGSAASGEVGDELVQAGIDDGGGGSGRAEDGGGGSPV